MMMSKTKQIVRKYWWLLNISVLCFSCTTDNDSPAFNIPSEKAQSAFVEFSTTSASSPFYYRILAQDLIINWGDNTRPNEYVHWGGADSWFAIRPIEHTYANAGTYLVDVRTNNPFSFDFSRNDSLPHNTVTKLRLETCYTLSELYCRHQPITQLDLTSCTNLRVLDIHASSVSDLTLAEATWLKTVCIDSTQIASFDAGAVPWVQNLSVGGIKAVQEVKNRDTLKELKRLYVNGKISETDLNVSVNDSLQYLSVADANVINVDLKQLALLDSISLIRCNDLQTIDMGSNPRIRKIVLVDNSHLSSDAINNMLRTLPQTDAKGRYIKLSGNAGDEACDKSIATRKGWIFE